MWWLLSFLFFAVLSVIFLVTLLICFVLGTMLLKTKDYSPTKNVTYADFTVVGHPIRNILNPTKVMDLDMKLLRFCKQEKIKYTGGHEVGSPYFFCHDLDILKQILIKDFDHFVNRRELPFENTDPVLTKMLFSMEGSKWKSLRSKLSPTFTTGKIKKMFKIFDSSSQKFVQYLSNEISQSASGEFDVDLTVGFGKYTMDAIASTAFGIETNLFTKNDSLFEQMGQKTQFKINATVLIKLVFIYMMPNVVKHFGVSLLSKEANTFFSEVVESVIKHRETSKEKRDDLIQLMLAARDGKLGKVDESELGSYEKDAVLKLEESDKIVLNDEIIMAQCILFIMAGYDTSRGLLLFTAYQLALCPEYQEKLAKEVEAAWDKENGEFTYESINHMEYLDKFVNETLRMFPPTVRFDRRCTKAYHIPDTDVTLAKDTLVLIPVYAIHHDEDHFPNPEIFDPERFSAENKAKRHSYAFMPFGHGPRNCIGMRFALTESKVVIAHFVRNFIVEPCERTLIPMEYENDNTMKPTKGMWLRLKKRI